MDLVVFTSTSEFNECVKLYLSKALFRQKNKTTGSRFLKIIPELKDSKWSSSGKKEKTK